MPARSIDSRGRGNDTTLGDVWLPETETELERAIAAGEVRETASFDAKAALPPPGRNKDLAKDICAMTVDGGVLLYGLGGDDPTRPNSLQPIDLAGAAERIDQVAQTGISEPPALDIRDIASSTQDGRGYLVVAIPASPRAPHMLILRGDNRYWGRGATGNRLLSEGEVARLYARRDRWEMDRRELMQQALDARPFPAGDHGDICLVARPVAGTNDVLSAAATPGTIDDLMGALRQVAAANDPYPDQGDVSIGQAFQLRRRGADVWALDDGRAPELECAARLDAHRGGLLRYWSKPMTYESRGHVALLERSVTRDTAQLVAAAHDLYRRAGYVGPVDIGVTIGGLEQATGASLQNAFTPSIYGISSYDQSARSDNGRTACRSRWRDSDPPGSTVRRDLSGGIRPLQRSRIGGPARIEASRSRADGWP